MTDLERARELIQYWKGGEQYVGQHMSLLTNFEPLVPLITAALAAARREGAEAERAKWEEAYVKAQRHVREAGAEEMRERAVLAARDCLGVEVRGDGMSLRYLVTEAIRALPVTPEGLA